MLDMFRVTILYTNGDMAEYDVSERLWHRHLFFALEADDSVLTYEVRNLTEEKRRAIA